MNNRPPNCKAYERGNQWFCDRCGVTWDHDDDDPPKCKPYTYVKGKRIDDTTISTKQFGENMAKLREALNK